MNKVFALKKIAQSTRDCRSHLCAGGYLGAFDDPLKELRVAGDTACVSFDRHAGDTSA